MKDKNMEAKNLERAFDYINEQENSMIELWSDLCKIESPSSDHKAVNNAVEFLHGQLVKFGMNSTIHKFKTGGNSLSAFFPLNSRILNNSEELEMALLGHLDTVHKKGSFGKEIVNLDLENNLLYGPGVVDCKGGVIVSILVARALNYIQYNKVVKLIYSGDEEVGHAATLGEGRDFLIEQLKGFNYCINCESGYSDNKLIVGRRGAANFKIIIKGKASHSGNNPQLGVSAIKEAAHKIINIEKENDYENIYYNVGVIEGGTTPNTIPENCSITVNVRYKKLSDINIFRDFLKKITETSFIDGIVSELVELSVSYPMEQTEGNMQLFNLIKKNSEELNIGVPYSTYVGGGSDSSCSVFLGIPTVCGMGAKGFDIHTLNERAIVSSLVERAKLIIKTILSLPTLPKKDSQ